MVEGEDGKIVARPYFFKDKRVAVISLGFKIAAKGCFRVYF